jgi:thioredoxin-like negative regulator of GroEL
MKAPSTVSATLLLSTHCPHCSSLLESLSTLVKSAELRHIHIINIEAAPEIAQKYAVRSVPWLKIGDYILTGVQDIAALRQRIEWTKNKADLIGKFDLMLSNAQAYQVVESIQADNNQFDAIVQLLEDPATIMSSRIGIGVVMEEFADTKLLQSYRERLEKLLEAKEIRIRVDAAHYLSLTASRQAIVALKKHRNDDNADVREVIEDSIEVLSELLI